MARLTLMKNIGKELEKKLISIGIDSSEKLIETGSKQAFERFKEAYSRVCLFHLYALEGAITDTEFDSLSKEKKKELKEFSDLLR